MILSLALGRVFFFNKTCSKMSLVAYVAVAACNVPTAFVELESFFKELFLSQI